MRENKKGYIILIAIYALISVNYQAAETSAGQAVQFFDPNLSMCVADAVGDSDGEITTGEMRSITTLSCEGDGISSLEGLQSATQLRYLNLSDNSITDITPLTDLVELKTLDLSDNQITDIDSLQNLTTLQNVFLNNNYLSDISVLGNLPELYHLELSNNEIDDISSLHDLDGLRYLYLSDNQISDVSPIANLNHISAIDLSDNQISDLSPLKYYPSNVSIYANRQRINFEDIVVYNDEPIRYNITDLRGLSHTIEFDIIQPGENNIGVEWDYSTSQPNSIFNGSVNQTIYYDVPSQLSGDKFGQINEEHSYTDAELISLFKVSSSTGEQITVDSSKVNYSVPGTYPISFSDESGNTLSASLEILDVLPEIKSLNDNVYIPIGSNINLISVFGVTAMEINAGDLNNKISVDTTQVNLNKEGVYSATFSVVDEENNFASFTGTVNVIKGNFTIESNSTGNARVYVQKIDESGNGMGGYEYTIYDKEGNVVDIITTDENGYGESKCLKDGDYTIVLTGKPDESSKDKPDENGKNDNSNSDSDKNNGSGLQANHEDSVNSKSENGVSDADGSTVQSSPMSPQQSAPMQTGVETSPAAQSTTAESEVLNVTDDTDYSKYQNGDNALDPFQFEVVLANGESPAGIVFNIVDEKGNIVQTVVSDENGIITIKSLPEGNYKLQLSSKNDEYVIENEINLSIDPENSLTGMPPQITLKEKQTNYVVVAGSTLIGILVVFKLLPKLLSLLV